ncbi:MAG: hypothetical protein K0R39_472 [Symbiobacteriaceae bacterium]|jgi:hypothetical protein|nr:hypothetical protein [Symbiobacteriaceae bacterium]
MEIITYSLRAGAQNSDQYYADAAAFTDEFLTQCEELAGPLLGDFQRANPSLSREERMLELLSLGTLWHIYSDDATELGTLPAAVLARLAAWRQECKALKPTIDWARGILATLFLEPEDDPMAGWFTVEYLDKLLDWLAATGEFRQEVAHLRPWRDFFAALPPAETADHLITAVALAIWFEDRSLEALGGYTEGVDRFLSEEYPCHRWREDVIFTGRKRVEYHLNMVGAEIMNRAFRADFVARPRKVVLVPACMRALPEADCKAEPSGMGLSCGACEPRCRVHQLTKLGEKYGFGVRILPHESDFSGSGGTATSDIAIVGVACVTNLVAGGWKAQALGLPAQCVLLDYAGCRNHWDDEGIPTEINIGQLKRVLALPTA